MIPVPAARVPPMTSLMSTSDGSTAAAMAAALMVPPFDEELPPPGVEMTVLGEERRAKPIPAPTPPDSRATPTPAAIIAGTRRPRRGRDGGGYDPAAWNGG